MKRATAAVILAALSVAPAEAAEMTDFGSAAGVVSSATDAAPGHVYAMDAASGTGLDALRSSFERLPSWSDLPDAYLSAVAGRVAAALDGRDGVAGHFVVVVDRSPRQAMMLFLVSSDGADWDVVYQGHVSTGKPGRKEHFMTPAGVFALDGSILDYRAEGTFNENHIRGLGLKGSRVWDFGWQETDDWRVPGARMKIRMEMHATDPANLETRIGRPDSEGCIRIHADLNALMDRYGVLDQVPNALAQAGDPAWRQVLGPGHVFLPQAGRYLVVIDGV